MLSTPNQHDIERAVKLLQEGSLIGLPTETVYGLAADASNPDAVAAIFIAKGRPANNPLITHVANLSMAARYGTITPLAMQLAERYWPGPVTLILERLTDCPLAPAISAGGDTIAVRAPAHPIARSIITAFDGGLAAPSANRSGRISPTCADHVAEELGDNVALILNGGACEVGIESTVIDARGDTPVILRRGSILEEEWINAKPKTCNQILISPGMLSSHYAPSLPVRLDVTEIKPTEALLAFGKSPITGARITRNLSPSGDLVEAAHNLFAMMRQLDTDTYSAIAVMPIPNEGIGIAINDRLHRAAKER